MNNNKENKQSIILVLRVQFLLISYWITIIFTPFQSFARFRGIMPGFTAVDYVIIGIGVSIALFIIFVIPKLRMSKREIRTNNLQSLRLRKLSSPMWWFLVLSLISYITYILSPVMKYPNEMHRQVHWNNLDFTLISFYYMSMVICVGVINVKFFEAFWCEMKYGEMKQRFWYHIWLSVLVSITILYFLGNSDKTSHYVYELQSIFSMVGFYLCFQNKREFGLEGKKTLGFSEDKIEIGKIDPENSSADFSTINSIEKRNIIRKFIRMWLLITIFLLSVGSIVFPLYFFNVSLKDPREYISFGYIYLNIIISACIFGVSNLIINQKSNKLYDLIPMILAPLALWYQYQSIYNRFQTDFGSRYISIGMSVTFGLWSIIKTLEIIEPKKKKNKEVFRGKFIAFFFIIMLGGAGYIILIPSKFDSLITDSFSNMVNLVVWCFLGINVLNFLLLSFLRYKKV